MYIHIFSFYIFIIYQKLTRIFILCRKKKVYKKKKKKIIIKLVKLKTVYDLS